MAFVSLRIDTGTTTGGLTVVTRAHTLDANAVTIALFIALTAVLCVCLRVDTHAATKRLGVAIQDALPFGATLAHGT